MKGAMLKIERKKERAEQSLNGKYLLSTNAERSVPEDLALGSSSF
jgi:hypothetical protein